MKYKKYNIDIVDSGLIRPVFAGTYILKSEDQAALIEVSTAHAVTPVLNRLKQLEIKTEDVKYIFVTHIHLDHAGGAGALLKHLPNAKLVLHPSGSKHMIDPDKLIKGANAVYGEDVVLKDYGTIIPVPEKRVVECKDGEMFTIGIRKLQTIYTPGHARHHISIFDNKSQGLFTGDSFGLSYPEMDSIKGKFLQPTTTPTAFEYEKMIESIDKMLKFNPKRLYLTHYGEFEDINLATKQIKKRLKDYIELASSCSNKNRDIMISKLENKLKDYYLLEAVNHNTRLNKEEINKLFDIDIKLNAMGLALWYQRKYHL